MKVKLIGGWFAPTEGKLLDPKLKLSSSGYYWPPGEHEMPDDLYDFLPTSAVVLDKFSDPEKEVLPSLKEMDGERASMDAAKALMEKFNKEKDK